jgi:hypothetical protein
MIRSWKSDGEGDEGWVTARVETKKQMCFIKKGSCR